MPNKSAAQQILNLLSREHALAEFGTYAFGEVSLQLILNEAARVCAAALDVPFSKICRYRPEGNDLLIVAGYGWNADVVGVAISVADESSPQGRAFTTGKPQVCGNVGEVNTYRLPSFYPEHGISSTVDVLVAAKTGPPFGVLEVDGKIADAFDETDIDFLTSFANILAEAVAASARAEDLRETIASMEQLIAEKEILAEELKHRVRNSLHMVYGLLTAELGQEHPDESLKAFRSIAFRVIGLSEVFNHLLGEGMEKTINLGDYVNALCGSLPHLYATTTIKLSSTSDTVTIELDKATALGIVLTELVNNAYIHAFPDDQGKITVALHVSPGAATLTIRDNGTGFVEEPTARRGMRLVRRLVKQVSGTIDLQVDHGSIWTVRFPVLAA